MNHLNSFLHIAAAAIVAGVVLSCGGWALFQLWLYLWKAVI